MPSKYKPTRDRKQRRTPKPPRNAGDTREAVPSLGAVVSSDFNIETIILLTKAQKEEKRKADMLAEARAENPGMSGKKLKRFNKYMENKLKKEEKVEIMAKLAAGASSMDTGLLRSTKELGRGRETKKERVRRAVREVKAGIAGEESRGVVFEERVFRDATELEAVVTPEHQEAMQSVKVEAEVKVEEKPVEKTPVLPAIAVGSGLKRPLEMDEGGFPIIKRVKKSAQARKERLMEMIKTMEREVGGSESEDEDGSDEDDEEVESEDDGDEDEEEWGGIADDIDATPDIRTIDEEDEDGEEGSEDEDSSEEGSEEEEDGSDEGDKPISHLRRGQSEKANAFKAWALAQRKEVLNDGEPEHSMPNLLELKPKVVSIPKKAPAPPPPPPIDVKKASFVTVERPIEIQASRLTLPVVAEEQRIMEAINANDCVVICGETGSGKTTQVPQFLYEAGYGSPNTPTPGLIGVTQPRRVAAVSMASRVGEELGTGGEEKVSYQIRFEGTAGPNTAIKFMTDGVLLRELSEDFLLRKYSAVIIDEAHERSINTDILIGVMSRVLKIRKELAEKDEMKPLKLIIMSATLRVSDFTENQRLFPAPPPLLKAEARQHPVSIHFSRRTVSEYPEEIYKKVCKIHRRLPPGGILVFLTGQNEITHLLKRLWKTFPFKNEKKGSNSTSAPPSAQISAGEAVVETEDMELGDFSKPDSYNSEEEGSNLGDDDDLGEEMSAEDVESPLHVLPLYSLLPTKEQLKVFEEAPEGSRMCVLATNVAETSLTIPGVRYVVDCGRSKERNYDKTTGVQSFDIGWVSKASAAQRAGRSGRTGPGHCYRLYSSAVYERDFPEFAEPEILRMPIEGLVLQMKSMNIDTIANFPFPTAPDRPSLQKSEKLLEYLGALDPKGTLTELGRIMNFFPLSPRFSKILIIGQQHGCLPYIIAIVAALSVGDVFIPEHQLDIHEETEDADAPRNAETALEDTQRAKRRKEYYRAHRTFSSLDATSDALKLLSVVCAYEYEKDSTIFCERNFIRLKAMQETHKLRQQISKIVKTNCPGVLSSFDPKLTPPSTVQVKALKQIIAAGFVDQVAIRADLLPNSPYKLSRNSAKKVTEVPYMTLFASSTFQQSTDEDAPLDPAVYIHPSSVLASQSSYPKYLVYSELKKSASPTGKVRMKPLTPVTGVQLAALAKGTPLITYSKPLEHVPPKVLEDSMGKRRECWVVPRIGGAIGRSEVGWGLPARKVVQRKEEGKWIVE
ncbi:P-loop containing nucleoside triphosphate hydrolase protein [Choiromyces venosus 120613-1]|uniref:RNA helicase n=1 Tax=Choiromyces venosus 120613-1 TaxID=1336337 RepID=A0A3N4K533_9PEZI|nr:P-loop containing nucleoside triphosphate hydrolase protein [Choiromyces venosus 120613-1]